MVSADCEPTSASRIRCSREAPLWIVQSPSTVNVYGMHDWPDGLRVQADFLRKLAKQTDDPVVKNELLELASFCEDVADNIEDHLTGDKSTLGGVHRC